MDKGRPGEDQIDAGAGEKTGTFREEMDPEEQLMEAGVAG